MRRLLFSTKALWHAWRARNLQLLAVGALDAAEVHAAEAMMNLAAARSLARAPLPGEDNGAGEPRASEPSPAGRYSAAEQALLATIVGLFIAGLWIWFCARAGR